MKYLLLIACVLLLVSVAISVDAQTVRPDRISFYNEPPNKLESHINYADGRPEEHKRYGVCVPGLVISETLNLYTISWTVEECTNSIYQHLNLRWVENCIFDFEHDPWARITTHNQTIVDHYDQGEVELALGTDVVSMTVAMSHTEGVELWTGNALFVFNEPLDCTSAPTPTEQSLPAQTPTEDSTSTPEPSVTPSATMTPTAEPEPSSTATETTVDDTVQTPTPVVVVCCPSTPEAVTPTSVPPTGLTPDPEPGLKKVYLPVVER